MGTADRLHQSVLKSYRVFACHKSLGCRAEGYLKASSNISLGKNSAVNDRVVKSVTGVEILNSTVCTLAVTEFSNVALRSICNRFDQACTAGAAYAVTVVLRIRLISEYSLGNALFSLYKGFRDRTIGNVKTVQSSVKALHVVDRRFVKSRADNHGKFIRRYVLEQAYYSDAQFSFGKRHVINRFCCLKI